MSTNSEQHSKKTFATSWLKRALIAFVIAAVLGIVAAVFLEIRMQTLIVEGDPSNPDAWSSLRIVTYTLGCFLLFFVLLYWIFGAGPKRLWHFFRDDGARNARRAAFALLISVIAALAGAFIGYGMAYAQDNVADWRYSFTGALFCVALGLFIYFWREIKRNGAWGYLIAGLTVGLLLVGLMPIQPASSWDGEIHFNRANAMSYGEKAEYDGGDRIALNKPLFIGGGFDLRLWALYEFQAENNTLAAIDEAEATQPIEIMEDTNIFRGRTWMRTDGFGNAPAAIGLWFGRILGFGDVGEYTFARLFNMLTYVLLWFAGIRYLKSSQIIFSFIALTPVALFMSANFSYDPFLIACTGLAFCRFIGELQRPEEALTCAHGLAILVPFLLGCCVKAVYFPLALVFMAMPRSKFIAHPSVRWLWWASVVATALLLAASFALPFLSSEGGGGYTDSRGGEEVNSGSQLSFVLSNPGAYLSALAGSAVGFMSPVEFKDAAATIWYITYTPYETALGWTYIGLLVLASLFARTTEDRLYGSAAVRITSIIGLIGAYILIASALYISFTVVGSDSVAGLQAKYLLPFFSVAFAITLNIPALALHLPDRVRSATPVVLWSLLFAFYLAFFALRFVAFFQ